jgi:hypothetical protein
MSGSPGLSARSRPRRSAIAGADLTREVGLAYGARGCATAEVERLLDRLHAHPARRKKRHRAA